MSEETWKILFKRLDELEQKILQNFRWQNDDIFHIKEKLKKIESEEK